MKPDERKIQLEKIKLMNETLEQLKGIEERLCEIREALGPDRRMLNGWKGGLVVVLLDGSETSKIARLKDFDSTGVYLGTDGTEELEPEAIAEESYHPWCKVKLIRPFRGAEP